MQINDAIKQIWNFKAKTPFSIRKYIIKNVTFERKKVYIVFYLLKNEEK